MMMVSSVPFPEDYTKVPPAVDADDEERTCGTRMVGACADLDDAFLFLSQVSFLGPGHDRHRTTAVAAACIEDGSPDLANTHSLSVTRPVEVLRVASMGEFSAITHDYPGTPDDRSKTGHEVDKRKHQHEVGSDQRYDDAIAAIIELKLELANSRSEKDAISLKLSRVNSKNSEPNKRREDDLTLQCVPVCGSEKTESSALTCPLTEDDEVSSSSFEVQDLTQDRKSHCKQQGRESADNILREAQLEQQVRELHQAARLSERRHKEQSEQLQNENRMLRDRLENLTRNNRRGSTSSAKVYSASSTVDSKSRRKSTGCKAAGAKEGISRRMLVPQSSRDDARIANIPESMIHSYYLKTHK